MMENHAGQRTQSIMVLQLFPKFIDLGTPSPPVRLPALYIPLSEKCPWSLDIDLISKLREAWMPYLSLAQFSARSFLFWTYGN